MSLVSNFGTFAQSWDVQFDETTHCQEMTVNAEREEQGELVYQIGRTGVKQHLKVLPANTMEVQLKATTRG